MDKPLLVFLFAMLIFNSTKVQSNETSTSVRLEIGAIENVFKVTDRIFSGGEPAGDAAFSALKALGVKTILSVDGTKPDVERAEKFGLRYIHIPHGYDGISSNTALRLIKAAQTSEEPLYVHCHHGEHRGPAAVGLICQATAQWTTDRALAWLKQAGTSTNYPGLFAANSDFRMPDKEILANASTNFPARAEVSNLIDAMLKIDLRWEHLKQLRNVGWRAPENHPDLVPATEAMLLREGFREAQRGEEAENKGADFLKRLAEVENEAAELQQILMAQSRSANALKRAKELTQSVEKSCSSCHKDFRD